MGRKSRRASDEGEQEGGCSLPGEDDFEAVLGDTAKTEPLPIGPVWFRQGKIGAEGRDARERLGFVQSYHDLLSGQGWGQPDPGTLSLALVVPVQQFELAEGHLRLLALKD